MGTLNKFEVLIEPEKMAEEERPTAVQSRSKGFQSPSTIWNVRYGSLADIP
jgi:hypothetical protein